MKIFFKSKIIIAFLLLLIVGLLAFFAYPIIKKRYFTNDATPEKINEMSHNKNKTEIDANNSDLQIPENENTEDEKKNNEDDEQEKVIEDEPFFEVAIKDCSGKCEKYKNDPENFEYCRQICGLAIPKIKAENCSDLEGLEKDYCWKDLAISKKDFKICEKIADKGIKRLCVNYITEQILNNE